MEKELRKLNIKIDAIQRKLNPLYKERNKINEKKDVLNKQKMIGKCFKCGGRIIFTVSEGSIVKYLGPAISLAEKYSLTPYLKQSLEITKRRVEGIFGKEKETQIGLGQWF